MLEVGVQSGVGTWKIRVRDRQFKGKWRVCPYSGGVPISWGVCPYSGGSRCK